MHLGSNHDLITTTIGRKGTADDPFALTLGVAVAGVNQVDTSIHRTVDNGYRFSLWSRIGKVIRAETERSNLDAGPAQNTVFHKSPTWL